MATKLFQISDDGGSTYHTLPGNTASLNNDAEDLDDSVFGQNFDSTESGIISWTASGNAIWKGSPGYKAKILKGGTSSSMTDEATSNTTGKTYQIDDTAKRVLDPNVALTIDDNGSPVADADIDSIDFLFGKVTFDSGYTVTGPVTISGNFIPIDIGSPSPDANALTATSYTLTQSAEVKDVTDLPTAQGNSGHMAHDPGRRTVSLSVEGIYNASNNSLSDLKNRNLVIIEIDPVGDGKSIARGMFRYSSVGQSGEFGATEDESVEFTLNVINEDATLNQTVTPFSWNHDATTTLPTAVEKLLDAYIAETKPNVKYLHDGTNGQKGDAVITDISLSGGIGEMNEFSVEFQGDGALTAVP